MSLQKKKKKEATIGKYGSIGMAILNLQPCLSPEDPPS